VEEEGEWAERTRVTGRSTGGIRSAFEKVHGC